MMQVFDCVQGTDEWFRARMGIPTASEFKTIVTEKGRGGRETYMRKLAGEIITGQPMQSGENAHMLRGIEMEDQALKYYAFLMDQPLAAVGFVANHGAGCSPDALVGTNGVVEIKTSLPHIVIEHILRDEFPPEHKAQCQGQLWITEREFDDLLVYWPGMPKFIKRAYRDDVFIKDLAAKIDQFNDELAALVERVKRYEPALAAAA